MAGRFAGRVLIVTGGASGIGRAVAHRYTQDGGRVAIIDLERERAEAAAAELDGARGYGLDVSDDDAVRAAIEQIAADFGGVDAVCNAAGHADVGPIEEWDWPRFNRMISVHLGGTFLLCRYTVPLLRQRGGGAIVNISSIGAFISQRGNAPYGAAKAGILGLTRQLAVELAPEIRVNAVAPGQTRTPMTVPFRLRYGDGDLEAGGRLLGDKNPQRRQAEPEELAGAVCYLLSDDASFVTGQTLIADGGEVLW